MSSIKTRIKLTDSLLEQIKEKKLISCDFKPNGELELEFSEVDEKCEEFARELEKRDKEIDEGKGITLDADNIGRKYGL